MRTDSIRWNLRLPRHGYIGERAAAARLRRASSSLLFAMTVGSACAPLHCEEVKVEVPAEAPAAEAKTPPKSVPESPAVDAPGQQVKTNESPKDKRKRELVEQHGPEMAEAILTGKVIKDMTFEQVLLVHGSPANKEVIPPDAELWHYPDGELAFAAGKVSYVGLSTKKQAPRPIDASERPKERPEPPRYSPAEQGEAVPRPAVRVGDSYIYESRDPDNVERAITTKRTVVSVNGGIAMATVNLSSRKAKPRRLYFDREWNLVSTRNADNSGFNYSPPVKYFDFPLYPGKTWRQTSTENDTKTGRTRIHTVLGVVVGWENVSVPAGNFRAIRVSLETEVIDSATGERIGGTDISWYVPEVHRSVKSITSGKDGKKRIIQLISFDLAEQR